LGQSGLRAALRQALATAQGQSEALRRTRSLSALLLGLDRQVVFVASAEERALKGVPLGHDPVQVRELHIPLATSRSLLATAARERRPVHAFGAALVEGGAAVDRVVARLLEAQGLLCIPLSSGSGISGVVAAALDAPWDERDADEAATLSVLTMAAADAIAHAAQRSREEERTRAEVTAQFRAMGKRVVHEAGNPLAIVKNYLQVLANKAGQSGQFREELAILNEELDRIARIVQRMGDPFVAEGDGAGALDLNALVREVVTLCNETLFAGRGIEVHQQLDPGLPLLRSEPGAVKQVVLNLMTNAAEAMPQGGRLMLLTSDNVNLDGELFVLLQVTDTGAGVAAEVLQRLFQHGVSTKGEGHEGIGLTVSEGIVRRLGGRILCRSSAGRGTIFGVLLPRRPLHNGAGQQQAGASS
jgi:signal transduction histidine kinase